MALSAAKVRELGFDEMPKAGWLPTMVPGAPAGWAALNRRFGTKSLPELFAPAVSYAREGCPVPVTVAKQWENDARRIAAALAGKDVPASAWAKDELARAIAAGITDGTRPGGYAKREEVAAMVLRAQTPTP